MDGPAELPLSITVGPIEYLLTLEYKKILAKVREDGQPGLVGHISFTDEVITLDPNLSAKNQLVNILHEVMHGVFEQSGLSKTEVNEESAVTALSYGVALALIQNPDWLEWIRAVANRDVI